MDWYTIFKFQHVGSAVIWIGGAFVMIMLGVKAERSKSDSDLVSVVRQVAGPPSGSTCPRASRR